MQHHKMTESMAFEYGGTFLQALHALRFPELNPDKTFRFPRSRRLSVSLLDLTVGRDLPTLASEVTDPKLQATEIARNLQQRYWHVGCFLATQSVVVRGHDIDVFLRQSAEFTNLELTHPLSEIDATLDDILPSPDTLERMHIVGNGPRPPVLTEFVVGQIALSKQSLAA